MPAPVLHIDIVSVSDSLEALALHGPLEWRGAQVTTHWIGSGQDLIRVLGGSERLSKTVVLMCHGDSRGLVLPELHPSIDRTQPYHGALSPSDLREFLRLPGCTVLNTGCSLGSRAFADAFLSAGCKAYNGADGDPEGSASLFYCLHLFYSLICRKMPLRRAHGVARSQDQDTAIFRLYGRPAAKRAPPQSPQGIPPQPSRHPGWGQP